ncbi:hypothetical protein [Phaeacidiphilus oryzae]|jgi:hypothetical protein|uniref:hypothetical protein n=1 Tax=Phaeacidiphilus oryzae TaxID=348818 RepID=UPI00056B28DA|nr:hypothetical protein [Phaeacidiphilus oryzae]
MTERRTEAASEDPEQDDPGGEARPTGARHKARRERAFGAGARVGARVSAGVAGLAVLLAAGVLLWTLQPVRTVMLQSFTRIPQSFTELYFTTSPVFDGDTVIVPVSLNAHGTGVRTYRLRVTLDSDGGKALAATTLVLHPRDGVATRSVTRLRSAGSVADVRVALLGHPQRLRYSFGTTRTAAGS